MPQTQDILGEDLISKEVRRSIFPSLFEALEADLCAPVSEE